MLRPVFRERTLVGHDFVTELAGRVAQVHLVVGIAAQSRAVRLLAQTANETPIILDNVPCCRLFPGSPRKDRLSQGIACKHSVALISCKKKSHS